MVNSERVSALLLISETRHRWLLSPFLFNTVLEVLAIAIMQGRKKEKYPDWKEESKTISILR